MDDLLILHPNPGRFEEQITYALRQVEAGTPTTQLCREMGISEQTFYRWKKKYEGLGVAELRRLRQLEDENRKLKQLVAEGIGIVLGRRHQRQTRPH